MIINGVAAALVATAFVGQAAACGPPLWGFILVLLPVVVFLGLVTFVHLLETLDARHGIPAADKNRIRRFYIDLGPEFSSVVESPIDDDPKLAGILRSDPSWWRSLLNSSGMVEVINSVLVGVFCGLFAYQNFGWSPVPAAGVIGATWFPIESHNPSALSGPAG